MGSERTWAALVFLTGVALNGTLWLIDRDIWAVWPWLIPWIERAVVASYILATLLAVHVLWKWLSRQRRHGWGVGAALKRLKGASIHGGVLTWEQLDAEYPLGILSGFIQEDGGVRISSFHAKGHNHSKEPITDVAGYIRSDITNQQFPMAFNVQGSIVPPKETNGIPPLSEFVVTVQFPLHEETFSLPGGVTTTKTGVPSAQFLTEYAPFVFVFQYDGRTYKRTFSREYVEKQIETWRTDQVKSRALRGNIGGVTRKMAH
jgi:hypothetical protein